MARGVNNCTFIGNLGSDVEAKPVNDSHVANVSLAVNEEWGVGDEKKSRVEWVSLVFWGKGAEILSQYCKKGSKIYVTGRLQTRDWVDDNNDKHFRTEVVVRDFLFLDSPGSTTTADADSADDDLPF